MTLLKIISGGPVLAVDEEGHTSSHQLYIDTDDGNKVVARPKDDPAHPAGD